MYRTYLAIRGNKSMSVYEMNFKSHKIIVCFLVLFSSISGSAFFPHCKSVSACGEYSLLALHREIIQLIGFIPLKLMMLN